MADYRREAIHRQARYETRLSQDRSYKEIQQAIARLGLLKMQEALNGSPATLQDEALASLEKKRQERIRMLGLRPYVCPKCRDSGFLEHEACTCLRTRIYRDHYGALDVTKLSDGLTGYPLTRLDDSHVQPVYDATHRKMTYYGLQAFHELLDSYPNGGCGLLVYGRTGVGKTYLALHAAAEAHRRGLDVLYLRATEMHDLYLQRRLGRDVNLYYLETSGLLIVDDLGTEPMTKNVTREALYRVIEERHMHLLPTVFVTNLREYEELYGERISSRLLDETRFASLPIAGDDLRLTSK